MGGDCGWRRGEASEPRRRAQPQGCRGQSGEIPAWRIGAEQHSPAQETCLLTRRGGRGLGAEARASVLAGRESRKKSAATEKARDFFLLICFAVRKERGCREPPKRTPETGVSRGYQRGPQRQARAAAISAYPTATGVQREKRRDSRTEARCQAALTSPRGLSAQPPVWVGLGAEAQASVLAGRESGKKSAAAKEARDFFLPLCFVARKERVFRAPP